MATPTKSQKIKISLSIVWAVIVMLFAGFVANGNYSGFQVATFLGFSALFLLPVLVYWLGFWIWGEGYLLRILLWPISLIRVSCSRISIRSLFIGFGLLLCWLITPLYLADVIYDSSSEGITSLISRAIGNTIGILLIAAVIIRKRKTTPKPAVILIAILISSVVQLNSQSGELAEAFDVKAFKAEMQNATPENFIEVIKGSNTKIGNFLKETHRINEESEEKVAALLGAISCNESLCSKILSPATIQNTDQQHKIKLLLNEKYLNAVAGSSKIDAIFEEVVIRLNGIKNISDKTRFAMIKGSEESRRKIVAFTKTYIQSYVSLYNNMLVYSDFLENNESNYTFDQYGRIIFVSQHLLEEFKKRQSAVVVSANQVDEKHKELLEAYTTIQQSAVTGMQSAGLIQ